MRKAILPIWLIALFTGNVALAHHSVAPWQLHLAKGH